MGAFTKAFGNNAQHGGNLKPLYPDYFALPAAGFVLTSGVPVVIFGDDLVNMPLINKISVQYICDIGTQSGKNFILNPTDSDIGIHQLIIKFKNDGFLYLTKTVNLRVYAMAPARSITVMMVGDSLLYQGCVFISEGIDAVLNPNITFIGRQGTTIKHEGIPGASYQSLTSAGSPFFKNGVVDVPAYFTDNLLTIPDYIHMRLGGNDVNLPVTYAMTDAYMATYIINKSKLLVDGFLSLNPNIKIIIGFPALPENSGDGWNLNYDEITYPQNTFIQNIHRCRGALVATYDNGLYNSRVSLSTEVLYLDRDNGFPKDANGKHNNGLHPDYSGDINIGNGLGLEFNKQTQFVADPVNLTAVWIDDFARLSWTDNTGGTAQYEIYESKNSEGYKLINTTAPGATSFDNYTWQNANVNFKIRTKIEGNFSNYSAIANLITPLVWKSDQSILKQVIIRMNASAAGFPLIVDWGDGITETLTRYVAKTHDYTVVKNTYYIKLTGGLSSITYLDIFINPTFNGDLSKWILPETITEFVANETGFYGIPKGKFKNISSFQLGSTLITSADVNLFLSDLNAYLAINAPLQNAIYTLDSGLNSKPTGGINNADRLGIIAKYQAAGKTITFNVAV